MDIGSNDGTFLNFFSGLNLFGIDPSIKKLKKHYRKDINKIPLIFEEAYRLVKKKKFDLYQRLQCFMT